MFQLYNIELIFKNSKSQIKKNPKEFFIPPDFQCIYSVLISLCNENPEAAIFILSFFILYDYICICLLHLFDYLKLFNNKLKLYFGKRKFKKY